MNLVFRLLFFSLFFYLQTICAQNQTQPSFKIIPLGVKGGSDESNLSSYMVAPKNSDNYICLDAGTLRFGIEQALKNGLLTGNSNLALRINVKAYLISHPHLDHLSGLIINSPDDTSKNIYALPFCVEVLKTNYFTWKNWANFANEGEKPTLGKYHYVFLDTIKETLIENTEMFVRPFFLSHSAPGKSTAFLVRYKDAYLLYLGDTGSDEIEKSNCLNLLWQSVAPLIKAKRLKAIFIETSFSNEQPVNQLFGHLTPTLLMKEMNALSKLTGNEAMRNFPILITHIKPSSNNAKEKIKEQVQESNSLNLKLIFPEQAKLLEF